MGLFKRGLTTGSNDVKDSECIGAVDDKVTQADIGKLVKLGAVSFPLCADGDLIDGQIDSFREFTQNDGYPFGTVKKGPRLAVSVTAAGTATVGVKVVAAAQVPLGSGDVVADPYINGKVKAAADQGATESRWRIYEVLGNAAEADCKVIIERF